MNESLPSSQSTGEKTASKPDVATSPKSTSVTEMPMQPNEAESLSASEQAIEKSGANEYTGKATKLATEEKTGKVVNPADTTKQAEPKQEVPKQATPTIEETMNNPIAQKEIAGLPPAQQEELYANLVKQGISKEKVDAFKKNVDHMREEQSKLADAQQKVDTEIKKAEKEIHIESEAKDDSKPVTTPTAEKKATGITMQEKINSVLEKLKNNPVTNILTLPVRMVRYIFGVIQRLAQSTIDFIKK